MKNKIVYKVVYKDGLKLVSANHWNNFPSDFKVEYKIGTIVYPKIKGTKLFCFNNLSDARKFINYYNWPDKYNLSIYESEAYDVYKPKRSYLVNLIYINKFWTLLKKHGKHTNYDDITFCPQPEGTLVCSSIKLLQKVK